MPALWPNWYWGFFLAQHRCHTNRHCPSISTCIQFNFESGATFSLPRQTTPGQCLCNLATCWLPLATHTLTLVTDQAVVPRDFPAQAPYYLCERTQNGGMTSRDFPSLPQPRVHGHHHGYLCPWVKNSQVLLLYLTHESYLWDLYYLYISCIIHTWNH